jgi:hypothetical protein
MSVAPGFVKQGAYKSQTWPLLDLSLLERQALNNIVWCLNGGKKFKVDLVYILTSYKRGLSMPAILGAIID